MANTSIYASLGLDSSQFSAGLRTARNSVRNFTTGVSGQFVAAAGLTGMGAMVSRAVDLGREMTDLSRIAGLSVERFQELAFGARTVGIEKDKLSDILKDMNDRVGDFLETGGGPMADFFENIAPQVGVTAEQFRDLNSADALQLYVSSLEAANLSQADMTFYMEAIASDSTALIPLLADGGDGFKRLAEEAHNAGQVMSNETAESMRELGIEMENINNRLTVIAANLAQFGLGVGDAIGNFVGEAIYGDVDRMQAEVALMQQGIERGRGRGGADRYEQQIQEQIQLNRQLAAERAEAQESEAAAAEEAAEAERRRKRQERLDEQEAAEAAAAEAAELEAFNEMMNEAFADALELEEEAERNKQKLIKETMELRAQAAEEARDQALELAEISRDQVQQALEAREAVESRMGRSMAGDEDRNLRMIELEGSTDETPRARRQRERREREAARENRRRQRELRQLQSEEARDWAGMSQAERDAANQGRDQRIATNANLSQMTEDELIEWAGTGKDSTEAASGNLDAVTENVTNASSNLNTAASPVMTSASSQWEWLSERQDKIIEHLESIDEEVNRDPS